MRLLLVEDDARIARFVAKGLREQAYAVDVSGTGEDALYQAAVNTYDLVILDVMIPAPDGFAVCRELRKSGKRMPILMLTATHRRSEEHTSELQSRVDLVCRLL